LALVAVGQGPEGEPAEAPQGQLPVGLKEMPQPSSEPLPAVEPDPSEVVEEDAADA
jgi:hypothetical protein